MDGSLVQAKALSLWAYLLSGGITGPPTPYGNNCIMSRPSRARVSRAIWFDDWAPRISQKATARHGGNSQAFGIWVLSLITYHIPHTLFQAFGLRFTTN